MHNIRRNLAVAGLVVGCAAMSAVPAQAAEKVYEEHYTTSFVFEHMDNPCTPEFDDITLTIEGRGSAKTWEDGSGDSRSEGRYRAQLTGVAADGTRYVGSEHSIVHFDLVEGESTVHADFRSRLVSQGSAPNFDARFTMVLRYELPDSSIEIIRDGQHCRG